MHNPNRQNKGVHNRFDYDSDEFYQTIEQLAKNGANDKEIATAFKHTLGFELNPNVFAKMRNGKYDAWTEEENERRGSRIRQTLEGARRDINRIVRAVYLQTALGKGTNKTTTTVRRRLRIDGVLTENEEIQTTEVVSGISPNVAALSRWLYHYDKDWRRTEKGEELGGDDAPNVENVVKGIDVGAWIDKELTEFNTIEDVHTHEGVGDGDADNVDTLHSVEE